MCLFTLQVFLALWFSCLVLVFFRFRVQKDEVNGEIS